MFAADFRLSANWLRGVFADGGGGRLPREACAATALSAAVVFGCANGEDAAPDTSRAWRRLALLFSRQRTNCLADASRL